MSKCKNCGKTGLFVKVSNNGLCDNCETFVTANIQNHARIYNDSIRIIETSENPDAVYSRIKLVIETLYALLEYENKGITTINPAPSQLIEKFKYEVDRFLLESFNRANITLSVEILSLKSNEAKRKRIQKFLELINKYLPKVNYMEELVGIKQSLDVQLQGIPLQIGKTADRPKKLLPISTALVSREPHPAKLLLIENSYANRSQTGATINFAINLDDITGIRIIGPEEPSVIYKDLLVSEPKNPDLVAPPPYFPRYSELSANQRWVYLNWLNDIQSEINIGYVFLYYYGLERHLLVGDFEAAFSEILLLRKCHDNKSFENYSYNALLFSCACHNQPDLAQSILGSVCKL